jgi:nicotinamide-nucleotide amidase
MRAEIITIGDEILIGQIVDTNSAWIGQQMNLIGLKIHQISSVSDNREHILKALSEAEARADVILITGGLGPTKDDITKHTINEYFNSELVLNETVLEDVTKIFASFNRTVTEINRKQAEVPKIAEVIRNFNGTAPGMAIYRNNKLFVSMPGVPHEMKAMVSEQVIPLIQMKFKLPYIYHHTVLTQGIGESMLAEKIQHWEDGLAMDNIKLAYLPNFGSVRLRLTTAGNDYKILLQKVDEKVRELKILIAPFIYGYERFGETPMNMSERLVKSLTDRVLTISTAESCTGGKIASEIVSIVGASSVFKGSIVAYSNTIKQQFLNVSSELLERFGAVSTEVTECMAKHICETFQTNCGIAVSGIAGPDGGTKEKPVGTVCVSLQWNDKVKSFKWRFSKERQRNIDLATQTALVELLKWMESED